MSAVTSYRLIDGGSVWHPDGVFKSASVLVGDGQVVEVGPPGAFSALDAEVIPARGLFVVPGFTDAHTHLMALALADLRCNLAPARSASDLVARLLRHATASDDGVVVGVDFDESAWTDPAPVTRAALDAAFPDRPAYARRVCGHVGVVNATFLTQFADVAGVRGAVDAETGILVEAAVFAANRATRPRGERVVTAMASAVARQHALGITSIHDIVEPDGFDDYVSGLRASAPLRVDALLTCAVDAVAALAPRAASLDARFFRCAGVKRFADGSFGARTAALNAPYADADTRGRLLIDANALAADAAACATHEMVLAVHAIGDRAVDTVVDAMEPYARDGARLRIEHAELISDAALEKLAVVPIALVMQPNFVRNWAGAHGFYERRLGPQRRARSNPFRTLAARGIPVVFSSDGMPPGPLFGMRGATHHAVAGERIDARRALDCYTAAACRLPGHTRPAGTIAPGQWADLTLLSGNPILADLDRVAVRATMVGGKMVFRADGEKP